MAITLLFSLTTAINIKNADEIVPVPNYRVSKNIAFGSMGGGSSHHLWVLDILEEMYTRGHQIHFYSRV